MLFKTINRKTTGKIVQSFASQPITVANEISVPAAKVQILNYAPRGDCEQTMQTRGDHWLDLTLSPRPLNARANFTGYWEPQRFEGIGKIFMVPSGGELRARGDAGFQQSSLVCQLDPKIFEQWLQPSALLAADQLAAFLDIQDVHIHQLLSRLAHELTDPGFSSEALVELICAQLAIELGRYRTSSELEDNNTPRGLKSYQLRLIKERLNELGVPPSLAELAQLCGISVRHLTRGHRASTGQSIGDAIAEVRIKHAIRLLQTDMSIKAIALTLGFKSSASFCHVFRKAMAEPPGQYRQRFSRVRR
ncbi:hypothetical protein R50071_20410 [Halioxenophilus aromaticivorans]